MKRQTVLISLIAAGLLALGGWSLYQLGMRDGMTMPGATVMPAKAEPKVIEFIAGRPLRREIYIPGRLVNLVV